MTKIMLSVPWCTYVPRETTFTVPHNELAVETSVLAQYKTKAGK